MIAPSLTETCVHIVAVTCSFVYEQVQQISTSAKRYASNPSLLGGAVRQTAERVKELFQKYQSALAFLATSVVVFALDSARFMPGLAMGVCGRICIELFAGEDADLSCKTKECAIVQLALTTVCAGNQLVRSMATNPYWSRQPQEMGVGAFIAGMLSGVMLVTALKHVYTLAMATIPKNSEAHKVG